MPFNFKSEYVNAILVVGKSCGAGLATISLAGASVGVGVVFGSLIFALNNKIQHKNIFVLSNILIIPDTLHIFLKCSIFLSFIILFLNWLFLFSKINTNFLKVIAFLLQFYLMQKLFSFASKLYINTYTVSNLNEQINL